MGATGMDQANAFGQQEYLALKRQLNFEPRTWVLLAWVALDAAIVGLALWLLDGRGTLAWALAQPLLTLAFFNAFSLLHECGHGSASRHPWLNVIVGCAASLLCFIPYYPWKYIHQKHHAWTGNLDHDPVLRSLRRFRDDGIPLVVRVAWRSWIPLGALLQHIVYWAYPLQMVRDGEMTPRKLLRCALSIAWPLAVYGLLLARWPTLLLHMLPAVVLLLLAEELVNAPHHADVSVFDERLPIWEQYKATRSCDYPPGISELLVLNFNYHVEHHLFPVLPWYRLRRARALVREALGPLYTEAVGLSWNVEKRTRALDELIAQYRRPLDPCSED